MRNVRLYEPQSKLLEGGSIGEHIEDYYKEGVVRGILGPTRSLDYSSICHILVVVVKNTYYPKMEPAIPQS